MVRVTSEVGRLRRVLVHEPGLEVDWMVPAMMEELLFDDILFGDGAREEHGLFRRLMQVLGVEVLEAGQLLLESLEQAEARSWLLEHFGPFVSSAMCERLTTLSAQSLQELLVCGSRRKGSSSDFEVHDLFDVLPVPNWCFQRDPQIVVGQGVFFSLMATQARQREALLSQLIFQFHPSFSDVSVWFDLEKEANERPLFLGGESPCLEGGDVLVVSPDIVAVGCSERTNKAAIQYMARALSRCEESPRWLIAVELPKKRAYMHLDTIMTPIDKNACLVFPAAILPGGKEEAIAYTFDLHSPSWNHVSRGNFLHLLAERGVELEPIPCGGSDPLLQQREQWTDGANAFALAPGVITLYDRNKATADELSRRGFRVVTAEDVLLGREEVNLDAPQRTCILLPSHEISRARGGPHCLTHPLLRDHL